MATWSSRGLRGSTLEELINRTNEKYRQGHLALIQKIPKKGNSSTINFRKASRKIQKEDFSSRLEAESGAPRRHSGWTKNLFARKFFWWTLSFRDSFDRNRMRFRNFFVIIYFFSLPTLAKKKKSIIINTIFSSFCEGGGFRFFENF